MYIDILKIEIGTTRVEHVFDAESLGFDYGDCRLVGEWHFSADVAKNAREEVCLRARIRGVVEAPCDRCLEDFSLAVDRRFETYLVPARKASGQGKEAEISSEEIDEVFYSDPRISIADMVNEQIILELPAKLLCKPDCAGLCPGCGENLNQGKCSCAGNGQDPRLALLREMKKRAR